MANPNRYSFMDVRLLTGRCARIRADTIVQIIDDQTKEKGSVVKLVLENGANLSIIDETFDQFWTRYCNCSSLPVGISHAPVIEG